MTISWLVTDEEPVEGKIVYSGVAIESENFGDKMAHLAPISCRGIGRLRA